MKFEMPIAEIIALDVADIITTSTDNGGGSTNMDFGTESETEWG